MLPRPAKTSARSRAFEICCVLSALTLFASGSAPARAQDAPDPVTPVQRSAPASFHDAASAYRTANSNCAGSQCDTVWVGHKAGTFLDVAAGGVWNFDDGVAGTDSSQGGHRISYPYASGFDAQLATDRPVWAYDYGNMIDEGNTNLWAARDLAGRKYVKTGIAGAWHSDPMTNIRRNANSLTNGGELSAIPIAGLRSAWCGLRVSGDQTAQDALTGNYINGDLWAGATGFTNTSNPDWPGYANLWDQMMYKDFPSAGSGSLTARVRTDLIPFIDNVFTTGSGWFNPDPTNIANFVNNTSDSFMVYVGSPNENAFDTNRRWFSEVLDFTKPVQELFSYGNRMPVGGVGDTTLTLPFTGIQPVAGDVRIVFRVKTNRVRSDATTGTATGPNTKDGAAVVDNVAVNGGTVYGFESAGSVTARSLIPDLAQDGGPWATTGRPAPSYFHIENVANLIYEDLCGGVNSPVRKCNLAGNVLVGGDFDHADKFTIEARQKWLLPTVNLAIRTFPPGAKNDQGIDQETALRTTILLDYDIYSGFMSLEQSVFWSYGGRYFGPGSREPLSTNIACWSPWFSYPVPLFQPIPTCQRGSNSDYVDNISSFGIPAGQIDSLQVMVETYTEGWRFGGHDLGNTRGTYFDNLRVGLVRFVQPELSQTIWDKFQDQFPVNETVTPGDNGAFDTTTAFVRTGLNIVMPISGPGYIAGDTLIASGAYSGDGVTTGTRMDLVFRIDPGPGNYAVKGNRGSALVERDPAHPFWASYLADNGAFGTGGNGVSGPGHAGGVWDRNRWNSCRMDSAEINYYPIVGRGIGGPQPPAWMGAIHELDPKFGALGITHNVCFLVDPNGPANVTNTSCTGTPPAAYATSANGGPPAGTTKEGTKIIPDGYLSPGAHVEYFLRRSTLESPFTAKLLFDTTRVWPQDPDNNPDLDQERWSSFDVLPDLWKSTRFGGSGLACMLMVDGADRRGSDPAYRGAADSLGYGKLDGATAGWHVVDFTPPNAAQTTGRGPNNPAGFVAANLGQYGLSYDHYDVRGAESGECGHIGARLASIQVPGNADPRRTDRSGPSLAMLATFYSTVFHQTGDLAEVTLDDFHSIQEQADDVTLYDTYLNGASLGNTRGLWLSGDGIQESATLQNGPPFQTMLVNDFGSALTAANSRVVNASQALEVGFLPVAAWAHPGRVYGFNNDCRVAADILALQGGTVGATEAAQYQNFAGPGPWTASIYRPLAPGTREYRTLIDGFDLSHVTGDYASLPAIGLAPQTDVGRLGWFSDVATNHFAVCVRNPPIVAVGDLPGQDGSRFADLNLGAVPNPAMAARPITLRFTLAAPRPVTVHVYNVAGREVRRLTRDGAAGPNQLVWDGKFANGARAMPGVYFYSITAPGLSASALHPSRVVLVAGP